LSADWVRARCSGDAAGISARGPADCRRPADTHLQDLPEYQRGSIGSLVRYLNYWDGASRPPDHTRLRRQFDKAVTPTSVESLRAKIEHIVGH